MLQDRTHELSSRTHAAGKWALVLSGVALVLLGMVLLGMTSSQPRSMPTVISVALPANWNTVASRFQVLRPWGPEKRTLANEVFELPPLNQQAVIENGNILSNVSVPATPRFDGDNTSNYMYNPPYDTAPPRDGIKDATKDSTTQLTTSPSQLVWRVAVAVAVPGRQGLWFLKLAGLWTSTLRCSAVAAGVVVSSSMKVPGVSARPHAARVRRCAQLHVSTARVQRNPRASVAAQQGRGGSTATKIRAQRINQSSRHCRPRTRQSTIGRWAR